MKLENNISSVVICEDLSETIGKTYIHNTQDAVNAAASLLGSAFTPNDIRNALHPALAGVETAPFPVTSKMMVAQIFSELLSSRHTPPKIMRTLAAEFETMLAINWDNPTVLKIAACIQALDDCERESPTIYRAGVELTFDEEQATDAALRSGHRAKAESMLTSIKSGKAATV